MASCKTYTQSSPEESIAILIDIDLLMLSRGRDIPTSGTLTVHAKPNLY